MRSLLTSLLGLFALCGPALAQGETLPWGQQSDMVSWEVFAQITAASGNPKVKKVEFETWASNDDIYKENPARWPTIDAPKQLQASALGERRAVRQARPFVFAPEACNPPLGMPPVGDAGKDSGFPAGACIGEEVRRNWASFQYIVSNGLDSTSGMAKAFANGLKVDLPADAIEFKGDWASVANVVKWLSAKDSSIDAAKVRQNYYTSTITTNGVATEVALLSFHVATKQIKNWVWSYFEGQLNPGRCDVIGCHDKFGATDADVKPNSQANRLYGECQKTDALKALLQNAGTDPVWSNYCLKGSQVSFVKGSKPILLGNSVIEPINAIVPIKSSSCITCHGYASFDKTGTGNFAMLGTPQVGNLDPRNMQGFSSYDFLWGPAAPTVKP
jgi:hypothetical protein